MANTPKAVNKVETVAFVNPSIIVPAKGKKPERTIKAQRGWGLVTSEKYPMNKFDQMLVDLAKKNGGSVKLNMQVSVNLNQKSDEPLDSSGIEILA